MNRIIVTVLAAVLGSTVIAVPAHAEGGRTEVCVADPHDPQLIHTPLAIEDGDDTSALGGMIVRPFPQNPLGCASYDGTPLQEWETLYPGTHTHPAPVVTAPQPAACTPVVIETSSVQTIEDTRRVEQLQRRVARQRALIRKLRSRLR